MDDENHISKILDLVDDPDLKMKIWAAYWMGCAEGYATCLKVVEDKRRNISHQEDNVVFLRPLTNHGK